jgi:hypothetical protein
MRKLAFIIFIFLFVSTHKVEAQGIDSVNVTSTFVTLGETWYTDYFTGYYVYTNRSFFKDENGGLHVAFLSNYQLYYSFSEDGLVWTTEQISGPYDGDYREAVIYADANGNPYIAVTVNPYFNFGNPTGVNYGDEFRYSVYYYYKDEGSWVEEEVFNSTLAPGFQGNFGYRVNELYQDLDDQMVLIVSRYGWYTYGGEFLEYTRDAEAGWSEASVIHTFSDTPVDHATEVSRVLLKDSGERDLIYTRPYNSSGMTELAYMSHSEGGWSAPSVLTTDMINHASWDISISPDEEMYLIHYSNEPTPHINMYTGFEESMAIGADLSVVDTIQSAKIHITEDGILDLLVYPLNTDTVILYASEDYGSTWGAPIYMSRSEAPGVLPVTDQYSDQGVDLEFIRVSRVSGVEPYGPDSLFYVHVEQINTGTLSVADAEGFTDNLSLYPNPFTDMVTVSYTLRSPGELNIRVFTLQGKMIMNRNIQGAAGESQIQMNLDHLDAGTYIIEVLGKGQSTDDVYKATGKLIKR